MAEAWPAPARRLSGAVPLLAPQPVERGVADPSWEETVRLDLYYVENRSVTLDAETIWKTAGAVLRGAGAR